MNNNTIIALTIIIISSCVCITVFDIIISIDFIALITVDSVAKKAIHIIAIAWFVVFIAYKIVIFFKQFKN